MGYDIKINDDQSCANSPTGLDIIDGIIYIIFSDGSSRQANLPESTDYSGDISGKADKIHTHTLSDISDYDATIFATAAQGAKADTATQPGANLSAFTNDLNIPTSTELETTQTNLSNHVGDTTNPHGVTKGQVGLSLVDNTADADKPVSSAQKTYTDNAKNTSISYTNSKLSQKVDKVTGSRLMTNSEGLKLAEFDEKHYRTPVGDITALAALAETDLYDRERRFVAAEGKDYFYDVDAASGDIAPSTQTSGTGFWKTVTATASDSYGQWILKTEGTFRKNMVKDSILDLKATGLLEVAYTAGGVVTYSSTAIEQKIEDKIKETTQAEMDQMNTDVSWTPGTLYVIPC